MAAHTTRLAAIFSGKSGFAMMKRWSMCRAERRKSFSAGGGTESALTTNKKGRDVMLWTLAVLLVVLWALGLVTSYTLGGFIHILLVLAVVVVLVRLVRGRRIT